MLLRAVSGYDLLGLVEVSPGGLDGGWRPTAG